MGGFCNPNALNGIVSIIVGLRVRGRMICNAACSSTVFWLYQHDVVNAGVQYVIVDKRQLQCMDAFRDSYRKVIGLTVDFAFRNDHTFRFRAYR